MRIFAPFSVAVEPSAALVGIEPSSGAFVEVFAHLTDGGLEGLQGLVL